MRAPAALAGRQQYARLRAPFSAELQRRAQQRIQSSDMPLQAFAFRVSGKAGQQREPLQLLSQQYRADKTSMSKRASSAQFACKRLPDGVQVQGVFFRQCTVEEANKQAVVGWVRNEADGSVAGEVQGQKEGIAYMKVKSATIELLGAVSAMMLGP